MTAATAWTLMIALSLPALPVGALLPEAPVPTLAVDANHLDGAIAAQATLEAFASSLSPGASFGDRLLRVGGASAHEAPTPTASLDEAVAALYAAAGLAAPAGPLAPLEPSLAEPLAPLVLSIARAAAATEHAFSDLTPEERTFLEAHLDELVDLHLAETPVPGDLARAAALAARVDTRAMTAGAAQLADAMEDFATAMASLPPAPRSTGTCLDPACLIEVGGAGNDVFDQRRVLIVDPAGNDLYTANPASTTPGLGLAVPVSVVVDVAGADTYRTDTLDVGSTEHATAQGVGAAGIGLLLDAAGDDRYLVTLLNEFDRGCPGGSGPTNYNIAYAQGVGVLGVGALLDATGSDTYTVDNRFVALKACHTGVLRSFAQGAGLHFGVGLLADLSGDDAYASVTEAGSRFTNFAITGAQGVGFGGVGVQLDAAGNDRYTASAYGHEAVSTFTKASYGWTFAQGATHTTNADPTQGRATLPGCVPLPIGGLAPVCLPAGAPDLAGLCASLSPTANWNDACSFTGMGILVDAAGADVFDASARAAQPTLCASSLTAMAVAQGAAGYSGLAALVNLDVAEPDTFRITTHALGVGCSNVGSEGYAFGQGYGGPASVRAPERVEPDEFVFEDLLTPLATKVSVHPLFTPAIGILASGQLAGMATPVGAAGADTYDVRVTSVNPLVACVPYCRMAVAVADAQGYGSRLGSGSYAPGGVGIPGATMDVLGTNVADVSAGMDLGIGALLDWSGPDTLRATADGQATLFSGRARGQGASVNGIGLLVNVGGGDTYSTVALHNGVPKPTLTSGQAWAAGTFPLVSGCVAGGAACLPAQVPTHPAIGVLQVATHPAIGVLVDLGGSDTYSEAAEAGSGACQQDDAMWGTAMAGLCAPAVPAASALTLGLDQASVLP